MTSLPDVNVLLALFWDQHPHHPAARDWFSHLSSDGWATCQITQSGLLRLVMNPQIVGVAWDASTAVGELRSMTTHPDHRFVSGAPALTDTSINELARRIQGYRQMTDATLLQFARANGLKLITFDQGVESLCPWPDTVLLLKP